MEYLKLVHTQEELESADDNCLLEHFGVTCMRYVHGEVPHRYVNQVKTIILQRISRSKEKDSAATESQAKHL